ncbi:hypothetical protein C0Q70_04364 [Pomacea canaliculata]|uniref:Long-chain-fatty-acid--CoA ligase n=1 Tax=Pomacea canaliculata TaxID=400727 RepID=A0A2T7PVB1_POMCA|nr:hypothetical protein C0Q70_04364 [Pomacea canaliculata]
MACSILLNLSAMDLLKLAGAGAVTVGAVTTATAFYLMRCIPQPLPAPVNFNSQSIVVLERAKNVGAGLLALGLLPQNSTHVGVYSQNRPEYVIADLALWSFSMVGVPLYDTLGPEACNHIINQADISVVICDINLKVKNLLSRHKETPSLKTIVVMEEVSKENQDTAKELNVEIIQYSKLEPAKPDDICIICYTSGTTGIPKGAMLTHRGYVATAAACTQQLRAGGLNLTSKDVMISYLPLAHSYERLLHAVVFQIGGQVGFFQGDVRKLMDDIKELQPTVFPCVPRLLNRFYDKVLMGVNASAMKRWLFSIALNRKERELKRYIIRNNSLWDKIVFKSIQTALGGKVRLMTTGSAPLSAKVLTFLRCIVGCPILEGYGQTESHAISNLQLVGDYSSGNVGVPLTCCAIKLTDIPEMNYSASENKGEICIKGHNVFCGYLKDKEKTEEAIDKDGWLHTGDVGQWLETGALKIIDRKKHIFKLAQGEYIAPEKVENVCVQSPLVAQMYIHGDSLQSCLVGVVVPDPEVLPRYVQEKLGIKETYQELCRHPEVKKMILGNLVELGRKSGLTSLEIVKDIYVYPELFSVENGLLTPTFKAKRQELCTYFKPQIDAMYTKLQ